MSHADWQRRGFRTHGIIPPKAGLVNPFDKKLVEGRGKVPGLMRAGGRWSSYAWSTEPAPPASVLDEWGAGVGVPCAGQARGIDIDCKVAAVAERLAALTVSMCGDTMHRWGDRPKVMLVYRAADPATKMVLSFWLPGDETKHKVEFLADGQQFVLAGQHPTAGAYERDRDWPLAECPELARDGIVGLAAAMGAVLQQEFGARTELTGGGSGAKPVENQASLLAPSEALLEEALGWVRLDGTREMWIECGIAVRAAGGTPEQWQTVSAKVMEEDPDDLRRRFEGFRPPFRLGWSWIEEKARAAGWLGSARLDFAGVDAPVLALKGVGNTDPLSGTAQEQAFRDYVWVEVAERFGCLADGTLLSPRNFSVRHRWWGPPMGQKNAAAKFLEDERRRVVQGITYLPGGDRIVHEPGLGECLNTWRPSALVPTDGDVGPYVAHLERVIPDARKRSVLLDLLAFYLQKQREKCNFAPLLVSAPGWGKDFILYPVIQALGVHNTATIGVHDVESGFNDWSSSARLVIFNEVHSASRVAMSEKMKPHISAPPVAFLRNRKGIPQWMQPNRHCMVFFSNRLDAVHIEPGDRRYFVLKLAGEKQPEETWAGLWQWMQHGGGAAAVAGWLMRRDISRFNAGGEAPWTDEKGEMARDTMSDLQAAVADAIQDGEWPDLIYPADSAARLNAIAGAKGRGFSARGVAIAAKHEGAQEIHGGAVIRLPAPAFCGAVRVRLLSVRNHEKYIGMPPAALARDFLKGWAEKDGKEFKDFPADISVPHAG